MKKFISIVAAILFAVIFSSQAYAEDACPAGNLESVLTQALESSPEDLVVVLEHDTLQAFWNSLIEAQLLLGTVSNVDKIYIIHSVRHPDQVYIFFLNDGCIVDVRMFPKSRIFPLIGKDA
jgi:hypothetical protein